MLATRGLALALLGALLWAPAVRADGPPAAREVVDSLGVTYRGSQVSISGELLRPAATQPLPAVILLHGCAGLTDSSRRQAEDWSALLNDAGYASFILDSFTGRGISQACTGGLPGRERAQDVYAAASYLAGRPDVNAGAIAVIGFSHGAWTALNAAAANQPSLRVARERFSAQGSLAAFIALYPPCRDTATATFIAPTLILIGQLDDWSPAAECERLAATPRPATPEVRLVEYPDAYHHFDEPGRQRLSYGHVLAYNAPAAADARGQALAFLAQHASP
jgi:dienelactone hydrolase